MAEQDITEEFTDDGLAMAADVLNSLVEWYRKYEPAETNTIETLDSAAGCIPSSLDALKPPGSSPG